MGKIVEALEQNTPKWHEFRKGKIGASLAPIIMQVSKWCTPWQLYMRMLGLMPEQADNVAMANGRAKEAEALAAFNEKFGYNCVPVVMQHDDYPWMIASLDGWDKDLKVAVEIKCPGKDDHEFAIVGQVPPHYDPQLQHQLDVMDLNYMYYWSWYKGDGICIHVKNEESYSDFMLEKELDFMRRLKELDPPPLTDMDYVENHTYEWRLACKYYKDRKTNLGLAESDLEIARKELIRLSGEHNSKGAGFKVQKVASKGRIDYDRVIEDHDLEWINWEAYRKPTTTSWRVLEE